ncbi:MAG: ice-binding family protein [Candidatus Taylorbacteria bacterium]
MKKFKKVGVVLLALAFFSAGSAIPAFAATTPNLGATNSFGILSDTFSNLGGNSIFGDLGYTTGTAATVSGSTHVADTVYSNAGTAQGVALVNLNNQTPCDLTFSGPIDLASETTHVPTFGATTTEYTPGIYCFDNAVNIGGGSTITLNGAGTYIFRMDGALDSTANSIVLLTGGASACDVFWIPTSATTLGANSTFVGTVIDAAGITIGDTVGWTGRALAFGGTVTASNDTITVPVCASSPLLTLTKTVTNDDGGNASPTDWTLQATGTGGSPTNLSGTTPLVNGGVFNADTYTLSESGPSGYSASEFSCVNNGGSAVDGSTITLAGGDVAICTVNNNDIPPPRSGGSSGGGRSVSSPRINVEKFPTPSALPAGPGLVTYTYTVTNPGPLSLSTVTVVDDKCVSVSFVSGDADEDSLLDNDETWIYRCATTLNQTTTNIVTATGEANGRTVSDTAEVTVPVGALVVDLPTSGTPTLPNTGIAPDDTVPWNIIISVGLVAILLLLNTTRKKKSI